MEEFGGIFHSFHGEHGKMMVKDVGNTHTHRGFYEDTCEQIEGFHEGIYMMGIYVVDSCGGNILANSDWYYAPDMVAKMTSTNTASEHL